jgi:hypothetical protein
MTSVMDSKVIMDDIRENKLPGKNKNDLSAENGKRVNRKCKKLPLEEITFLQSS